MDPTNNFGGVHHFLVHTAIKFTYQNIFSAHAEVPKYQFVEVSYINKEHFIPAIFFSLTLQYDYVNDRYFMN